jgi:predicted flap endonuclease-1-like 5' DNA nuclease
MESERMTMKRSPGMGLNTLGALVTVVLGFLLGLAVAWIFFVRRKEDEETGDMGTLESQRLTLEPRPAAPSPVSGEVEPEPDDLTHIEGIGPKISQVLQDAGILTFGRLAQSRPDELERILREEDERLARLADPTTWPEQATLAAAGAWEALQDLQEELTAGRRA